MFGAKKEYLPEVKGNYRKTLRVNNDALERLGWQSTDRLNAYIKSLYEKNNS